MPPTSNWRDLPFREIWIVDTEFYPGPGLANGGVAGDSVTPLCLVALEMRSGRLIRLWQDQLGPFPPYRLDYVEFRYYVNDGSIRGGDREKGFFSIAGALRYFLEDEIDLARKDQMRDRILQGPPFSAQERVDI